MITCANFSHERAGCPIKWTALYCTPCPVPSCPACEPNCGSVLRSVSTKTHSSRGADIVMQSSGNVMRWTALTHLIVENRRASHALYGRIDGSCPRGGKGPVFPRAHQNSESSCFGGGRLYPAAGGRWSETQDDDFPPNGETFPSPSCSNQ